MRNKILISVFIILFASSTVFTQKKTVYQCPNTTEANGSILQNAIQKTKADDKPVDFLTENNPCSHSKGIKSNLNNTIDKNLFNLAKSHTFSLIKVGEDFFSIEQFVFKTERQANLINQILAKRKSNMLQTPGVTFYDYFLVGNNLVFYIADRQVYRANLPFFQNVKENFLLEYKK